MSLPRPALAVPVRLLVAAGLLALLPLTAPSDTGKGDPAAAAAVRALTAKPGSRAGEQVPPDFAMVLGYTPSVAGSRLVRADGSCSSPVPLPQAFQPACREHDLGYDLLRYAAAVGDPLGPWARAALDRHFADRLEGVCAGTAGIAGAWCRAQGRLAATGVELNSLRQQGGTPDGSPLSAGLTAAAGSVLVLPVRGRRLTRARARLVGLAPPMTTTALVTGAILLSLVPSLLPRPAGVQGVLTGVLVALALGLSSLLDRARRRRTPTAGRPDRSRRGTVAALAFGVAGAAVVMGHRSQERLAASSGLPGPETAHWALALLVAVATAGALLLLGRGASRVASAAGGLAGKRHLAALATAGAVSVAPAGPAAQGLTSALDQPLDADHVMLAEAPGPAVRAHVSLDEAAGRPAAQLAARRLVEAGGLERQAVVVVVPTGSGWVNPAAVEGVERDLAGDVATVAVQYDRSPSWLVLVTERGTAEASATAVLEEVASLMAAVPEQQRPDLYVMGESLGALAGQAALASYTGRADAPAVPVCGVLWSGVPGGALLGLPGERAITHPDDPVVHLRARTALRRPDGWDGEVWLPLASYGGTVLDLLSSLEVPDGHGHRYGPGEDWSLPRCG